MADIIGVIDGIAFQTNILALNAAVEAARASEHGRGVAVVAGEVRALAQRSAQAAKEIKELIHSSVEKIGTGSELVQTAGATMNEIVESVRGITGVIDEITVATTEQSTGLSQVNQALAQLGACRRVGRGRGAVARAGGEARAGRGGVQVGTGVSGGWCRSSLPKRYCRSGATPFRHAR